MRSFLVMFLSGAVAGLITGATTGTLTLVSGISGVVANATAAFAIVSIRRGRQRKSQQA